VLPTAVAKVPVAEPVPAPLILFSAVATKMYGTVAVDADGYALSSTIVTSTPGETNAIGYSLIYKLLLKLFI
jgi:hypothetical protein